MNEEKKIPKHISEMEGVKFKDIDTDGFRRELIAVSKTTLAQIATAWEGITDLKERLTKECEDPIFSNTEWPRLVKGILELIETYKKLKEDEVVRLFEYIVKITKRQSILNQDAPDTISLEDIQSKAEDLINSSNDLPIRVLKGKDSIEGKLRVEFGKEYIELIDEALSNIELEKIENGQQ